MLKGTRQWKEIIEVEGIPDVEESPVIIDEDKKLDEDQQGIKDSGNTSLMIIEEGHGSSNP